LGLRKRAKLADDRVNGGADVNHGRVEKRQPFRFGAAEEERQLGAGEEQRFDSFVVAHPIDDADERGAGLGQELVFEQLVDVFLVDDRLLVCARRDQLDSRAKTSGKNRARMVKPVPSKPSRLSPRPRA
jgi:hypothetical protein